MAADPSGVDFAGPSPKFGGVCKRWILYFVGGGLLLALYIGRSNWQKRLRYNPGPHFGEKTRKIKESRGVVWCNLLVVAERASGIVEKTVDALQRVLKATLEVNKSERPHLMHPSLQILYEFNPAGPLEVNYQSRKRKSLLSALSTNFSNAQLEEEEHSNKVIDYVVRRTKTQNEVL
ncbi:hypothetical protein EPUL_004773 [Erysiphe pulchra]|uniref:Uncharacterized protein n=1 Tax=Erysiphe pulchra TaxID=225359 RepID=A0A2S4PKR1_9PEZI|nr:hypothetical protein EPUL_004773 [Erysiphe pulchra]